MITWFWLIPLGLVLAGVAAGFFFGYRVGRISAFSDMARKFLG